MRVAAADQDKVFGDRRGMHDSNFRSCVPNAGK
jgi:hypothetical protein